MDSYNNIYGRVIHPIKEDREVGGTSSGEAPLILTKCSVLGLTSEIVGSSRYPSLSCGVVSFTPSQLRGTNKGVHVFLSNKDYFDNMHLGIKFSPIARRVDDVVPLLRSI